MKKLKAEVLKLSLKVAEQIVRHDISLNQAICLNIVSEAIGKITDKEKTIYFLLLESFSKKRVIRI